jgi:hypothetical protein
LLLKEADITEFSLRIQLPIAQLESLGLLTAWFAFVSLLLYDYFPMIGFCGEDYSKIIPQNHKKATS